MEKHLAIGSAPGLSRTAFLSIAVLVTLLALMLRLHFVAVTQVESPVRGDVVDYVAYADNLLQHGVFSRATQTPHPAPDAFRSPGYPLFLALAIRLGRADWYGLALVLQAILGAATAAFTIALARAQLARGASLAVGGLIAVWPHHIAATGALLSEVVFGLLLVLGLLFLSSARREATKASLAGITLGVAALVNPVATLLPAALAAILALGAHRRAAIALLLAGALLPLGWAARNATLPPIDTPGRATMNFVQGSWPQYHRAHATQTLHPVSRDIMAAIDAETVRLSDSPIDGLGDMARRMRTDPWYYLHWYAIEKPYLLWDWDIRLGVGDVYFHRVRHSPLETQPALHAVKQMLHALNPAFFFLMLGYVGCSLWRSARIPSAQPASTNAVLIAATLVYLTAVHWVLQAEPRYAISYRPLQIIAVVGMCAFALSALLARSNRG